MGYENNLKTLTKEMERVQKYTGRLHIFIFIAMELPKQALQNPESSLKLFWNF